MANVKQELFLSVIEAHKGIIYKVSNAYGKDTEERKDLVQEIIFQLWKSFDKYNSEFKYSTWIYRIALNVAISFYRRETRRVVHPLSDDVFDIADIQEDETSINLLQKFIYSLNEFDKALILLYLEERSYKEIAEITGITETNVATKISRIKLILKQKFSTINF